MNDKKIGKNVILNFNGDFNTEISYRTGESWDHEIININKFQFSLLFLYFLQGVFRLLQFREFRDWLCKIPETKLSVDPKTENVEAGRKKLENVKAEVIVESDENKPSLEKHRMMQNMAQLWLQQEVN